MATLDLGYFWDWPIHYLHQLQERLRLLLSFFRRQPYAESIKIQLPEFSYAAMPKHV